MYGELSQKLVEWIRNKVVEAGAMGCVLGISGGVDSAVAASLCSKALPGNVLGDLHALLQFATGHCRCQVNC